MKRISLLFAFAILVLAMMACTISIPAVQINGPSSDSAATEASAPPVVINPAPEVLASEEALVQLYELVNPGVVSIRTLTAAGGAQGSGFVFDSDGHIVTNYHVVEGATELEVAFPSGAKVRGKVIGTDLDSDLAVIEVDVPADQLRPLALGDSDQVKVGQTVVAIGNPFGLSGTMTVGIVSAKGRTLDSMRDSGNGRPFSAGDIIQTDAAINPGNSGGPLINLRGEVVAVNRAIRTTSSTSEGEPSNSGIGFSISINIVKRVVPALIKDGQYDYPYLGISSSDDISLAAQEVLELPQTTGAYVSEVVEGGPADQAGIRAGNTPTDVPGINKGGDLITAIDGRPIRNFGELLSYLITNKGPGDQVVLTVIRENQTQEVTVTLGKRP